MKLSEQNQNLFIGILGRLSRQYSDMAKELEWRRRLALLLHDIKAVDAVDCNMNYLREIALQYETLINVYTDVQLS